MLTDSPDEVVQGLNDRRRKIVRKAVEGLPVRVTPC